MPIGDGNVEKKIRFTGDSSGLTPFMKKLQEDAKKLYSDIAKEAKKQTDSDKEQNKFIAERLRLLKEELRTKQSLAKEDAKRLGGNYARAANAFGADDPRAMFWKEKADKARTEYEDTREQYSAAKQASYHNFRGGDPKTSNFGTIFNATLLANIVKDVLGAIGQIPNARTQLDLITPAATVAGTGLGAAAGLFMSPSMAALGKEGGAFVGSAFTRTLQLREQFNEADYRLRARTGRGYQDNGFYNTLGYDDAAAAGFQERLAMARGRGGNSLRWDAQTVMGLSRGYGIDESTTLSAAGVSRAGGTNGINNVQRGLALAISEGLDRTKFSDAIRNQTELFQQFAKNSTTTSFTDVNRTLFGFNRLGGEFGIGDTRSMGNIGAIQEGLANPGSTFGQAQNYAVLRRLNPNASAWELRKMQQKGLQTPGFLNAILQDIGGGTGSEDFKKFQLMNRIPGLSMDAIDTLTKGGWKVDNVKGKGMLGAATILGEGMALTPRLQKDEADIADAFRRNMVDGVMTIKDKFVTEMSKGVDELVKILDVKVEHAVQEGVKSGFQSIEHNTFGRLPGWDKAMDEYYRKNGRVPAKNGN